MTKSRVDILLVNKGLVDSREKAKRLVLTGVVFAGERRLDKPGALIDESESLTIKENVLNRFVSRGGLKLEYGLKEFGIDVTGKVCADIGASTGGFTDCLLRYGAKKVYAIDVGQGQLDFNLRTNPNVVLLENTNARYLAEDMLPEKVDIIAIDVSFISLKKIFPVIEKIAKPGCEIIVLVKPQFEAGHKEVSKGKGIIKSDDIHFRVISEITEFANTLNLYVVKTIKSPIKGGAGNIEYLMNLIYKREDKQ